MQFFQLHNKLEELNKYFDQFELAKESNEMDYSELEEEKLLNKNGKKLFGRALISRLKEMDIKNKI